MCQKDCCSSRNTLTHLTQNELVKRTCADDETKVCTNGSETFCSKNYANKENDSVSVSIMMLNPKRAKDVTPFPSKKKTCGDDSDKECHECGGGVSAAVTSFDHDGCCETERPPPSDGCEASGESTCHNEDATRKTSSCHATDIAVSMPDRKKYIRIAMMLLVLTILLSIGESAASLTFGSDGGDIGLSLLGIGSDSAVEIISASLVLWRFYSEYGGDHHLSPATIFKERVATLVIGLLLCFLAISIFATSVASLALHKPTTISISSLIISCVTIFSMACLLLAKLTVNIILESKALASDAGCTRNCLLLSLVLMIGSVIGFTHPSVRQVDAATAIVISLFILYDGVQGIRASMRRDFDGGCGCEDDLDSSVVGKKIKSILIKYVIKK